MHSEQLKGESPTTNTNYLKQFMKAGYSHYALQELSHADILLSRECGQQSASAQPGFKVRPLV